MKTAPSISAVWLLSLAVTTAAADHQAHPTWTDPAKAKAEDPDFSIQGEYATAAGGQAWGVQVVAMGAGNFEAYLLEGKSDETGGMYSIADPLVNACLPPLTWQTYDVEFTAATFGADGELDRNARMTVRLNGVMVQDDVELRRTTNAAPIRTISPEPGPIRLQSHGNPVFYRNIWILEKK